MRDGGGGECIAIGGCGGHRVAVRRLGDRARRGPVGNGGVGIGALGDGGRAWCPQVIAIRGRLRSERTTRPFRWKRKLDISCFSDFFFQFSSEYFPGG